MRTTWVFILLCIGIGVNAQNWALLNPDYKYNYSNDGTDTISNQIFVTHIDTLGVDSFRYELNRISVQCNGCGVGQSSQCNYYTAQASAQIDQAQFLGLHVEEFGDQWRIGPNDGSIILPNAGLDSTWSSPNGSTASIFSVDTSTVLNLLDSVKWIGYSNGDTILLSKSHGLVTISLGQLNGETHELKGRIWVSGTEGVQIPDQKSLFDHQIADVLQYHVSGNWTDGDGVYYTDGTVTYTVIERQDAGESTTYGVQEFRYIDHWCYSVWGWQPCGSSLEDPTDTVHFVIQRNSWLLGNPFNPYWNTGLWPGASGSVSYVDGDLKAIVSMSLNDSGHYVVEQSLLPDPSGTDDNRLFCTAENDSSLILMTPDITFHSSFTEGIGLTREALYFFEGGSTRELVGYLLNGQAWGTILLDVPENERRVPFSVFPNPASDGFTVSTGTNSPSSLYLHDMTGRLLLHRSILGSEIYVEVEDLLPSTYLLTIEDKAGRSTQPVVIAP